MAVSTKTEWPTPAEAARNAVLIQKRAQATIAKYETMFRFSSADLLRKLSEGTIEETFEICQWVIALDALTSVTRGESA
jgi:hypothetical protein